MAPPRPQQALTGAQKAAMILVSVGTDVAARIFRWLGPEEVEQLVAEVASLSEVTSEQTESVLREFEDLAKAQEFISEGGVEVARDMLIQALGVDRANEILQRLTENSSGDVFHMNMLNRVDPKQLVTFIQSEHPQTIALILVQLQPSHAAPVLSALPAEVQPSVIARMATMEQISPEMIREIEGVLEQHLAGMVRASRARLGGVQAVAEMLNQVDRGTEKNIMEKLDEEDPDLSVQIKALMFVFEDILQLGDREIQRLLKDVDSRDLAVALKLASEELKEKIFRNLSQRASEMLRDELEYMGPIPLKQVEEAQRRVVDTVRRLDEAGEVHISRGDAERMIE
ncbi:MAG: flagellar motor switch protein FliG [Candidatus Eisenbacteria bacterium]|uniref:Flagellar motor switch protein FliG n=1 Tax=Eiseniibacteriota bacterium TaxID=2212470 RepID=A0A956N8R6_UNCEI|nr:flagellar motor switch protein FliG [Candidatus Eisenbacteria bacterium]